MASTRDATIGTPVPMNAEANGEDNVSVFEDDASEDGPPGTDDGESSVGNSSGMENKPRGPEEPGIGRAESRMVFVVRIMVIALLLVVTAGVTWSVHYYVENTQQDSFTNDYDDWSDKVLQSVGSSVDQSLGAIDNLMVNMVAYQELMNSSWPYVTIPNFGLMTQKVLSLSRGSFIFTYPLVLHEHRLQWENYSVNNADWVAKSIEIQRTSPVFTGTMSEKFAINPKIVNFTGVVQEHPDYFPFWLQSPIVSAASNFDGNILYGPELKDIQINRKAIMGRTKNVPTNELEQIEMEQSLPSIIALVGADHYPQDPVFPIIYPIIANATSAMTAGEADPATHPFVGAITMSIFWRELFKNVLSPDSNGIVVVVTACNQTFTYQINGINAEYLGVGDKHESKYNKYEKTRFLYDLGSEASANLGEVYTGFKLSQEYCPYQIKLYPSTLMEDDHTNNDPMIFTFVALSIFIFTSCVFVVYDCVSERRQKKVLQVATQSTAVVSSLFPQVVRERLFSSKKEEKRPKAKPSVRVETAKLRLQQFLRNDEDDIVEADRKAGNKPGQDAPIAELFSDTTVMFADIAGFTAWSSVREPAQVFTLLETLYGAFDRIASRRGVFKVETIGDSYVAVAGLPEPREDHAIVMSKFARDIRDKMTELAERLGRTLGPDTDGLELRIGLNSGPVTAGVLRGERSRFQLFGDTVNTAARMESTGKVSKIQASESTALLLKRAGKGHWVAKRDGQVEAKGKGKVQTYWIEPTARQASSVSSGEVQEEDEDMKVIDDKTRRLVDWNLEIMAKLLKQVVARRAALRDLAVHSSKNSSRPVQSAGSEGGRTMIQITGNPLDEVKEVIMLPEFDPALALNSRDINQIELSTAVMTQLREYISLIATMYQDNPFHSFEHASHVAMSVVKLLSRIVAPTDRVIQSAEANHGDFVQTLHDHTYGITSDPLTQFSCVFSALIHDVDHSGVPNAQLIKEGSPLNVTYKGKSLAEQNSVDIAWKLFIEDEFEDLREVVCPTKADMSRFRQLVVNAVMATDIMDKDLKTLRNQRWDKAFQEGSRLGETLAVNNNRKATIVIEHLIQASDVAHTMQHWHIFRKWNERLFTEMYNAYRSGRAETNPAEFWYKGEIGFFDFYIIPLAKKLSDCGVFGVSSDEYLNYALKNREEWENRGMDVVAEMLSKFEVPNEIIGADDKVAEGVDKEDKAPEKPVEKVSGQASKPVGGPPKTVTAVPESINMQQPEQAQPVLPVKVDL